MQVIAIENKTTHVSDFDTSDVIAVDTPDFVEGAAKKKYYMLVSTGAFMEKTNDGRNKVVDLETGIITSLSPDDIAIGYKKAALHLDATNPNLTPSREERTAEA